MGRLGHAPSTASATTGPLRWTPRVTTPEKFHAAGPTEGGLLIAAVYDSKEQSESFVRDQLMPLMPLEGGLVGPPEERTSELVNVKGI